MNNKSNIVSPENIHFSNISGDGSWEMELINKVDQNFMQYSTSDN